MLGRPLLKLTVLAGLATGVALLAADVGGTRTRALLWFEAERTAYAAAHRDDLAQGCPPGYLYSTTHGGARPACLPGVLPRSIPASECGGGRCP